MTDYKLGTKFQGEYKGKSLKEKAKEFVSTAVKQTKGSLTKERFTEEEKAERKKKQEAYIEKHGEMQPRRKKLYPVTKDGTKEKKARSFKDAFDKSKLKNSKFYGYSNIKKY